MKTKRLGNVSGAENLSALSALARKSGFTFQELMRVIRERSGISARQLSLQAGLSASYVSRMERGDFHPTLDNFVKMVDILECTDSEILFILQACYEDL